MYARRKCPRAAVRLGGSGGAEDSGELQVLVGAETQLLIFSNHAIEMGFTRDSGGPVLRLPCVDPPRWSSGASQSPGRLVVVA